LRHIARTTARIRRVSNPWGVNLQRSVKLEKFTSTGHSQRLRPPREDANGQVSPRHGLDPKNDQNERKSEIQIEQNLNHFPFSVVLQEIPMHLGYSESGECKQSSQDAAPQGYEKLQNDLGRGTTENMSCPEKSRLRHHLRRVQALFGEERRCAFIEAVVGVFEAQLEGVLVYNQDHHRDQ
jgi:hypothetical protein